jgi:carboxylate-amine ligase
VPLLQPPGANAPYWHGPDSALHSARTNRVHELPRTALPRAFRGWDDYRTTMRELVRVADIAGPESLWWDIRPHPSLGTLEVRVLDAQSSLDDLRGLIALVHCLTYHEALTADPVDPPEEILDAATVHAIRDGLDARLPHGGTIQHVHAIARQALDLAAGYAFALGCSEALTAVERLLADGNGAARQRRTYDRAGLAAVVEQLVRETGASATSPQAGPFQGAAA